ncbi:hypothetical protein ACFWF7_26220 [Nocardia sp. NPDC060256]|uniref:hypothetical protein n=1 Tax=unclassified Nocardia TaxID=2637762 RepID=UPI003655001B
MTDDVSATGEHVQDQLTGNLPVLMAIGYHEKTTGRFSGTPITVQRMGITLS